MACRSLARGTAAAEDIKQVTGAPENQILVRELNLASFASVRKFAKEFKAGRA
jgi:hypothetical protein